VFGAPSPWQGESLATHAQRTTTHENGRPPQRATTEEECGEAGAGIYVPGERSAVVMELSGDATRLNVSHGVAPLQ